MSDKITSAFLQVAVVLILSYLIFVISEFVSGRRSFKSFFTYMGFQKTTGQLDLQFLLLLAGATFIGIVNTILQFKMSPESHLLLTGPSSPYMQALAFGPWSIFFGLLYSIVQSSGSEEILFRGLIGKRLFNAFGFKLGNFIQAFIFWLMHLVIIRLVTGEWFNEIQAWGFVLTFGLGLLFGYVNFRKRGESILPSWILHATVNFATFLTLACLV